MDDGPKVHAFGLDTYIFAPKLRTLEATISFFFYMVSLRVVCLILATN